MSADEKFRCRNRNEWRLTPCSEGEDNHDCKPGFCGVAPDGSISAATAGSGKVYSLPNTLARDLSHESAMLERPNEVAMPRFEYQPSPTPRVEPKKKEKEHKGLRKHVLRSDDGVERSLEVPSSTWVEEPDWQLKVDSETGRTELAATVLIPDEQALNLFPDEPQQADVTVMHDGALLPPPAELGEDGVLHTTAAMPPDPMLLLPPLEAGPLTDPMRDDFVSRSPLAIRPPGWVDPRGTIDGMDPFGGMP